MMRIIWFLTALAVSGILYAIVAERDALRDFAGSSSAEASARSAGTDPSAVGDSSTTPPAADTARRIPVVAGESRARTIENAVLLRGRTEAARSVEVRAETSGRIVSEPARRGARIEAGDVLCRIDPATRHEALEDARARLAEAELNARNAERLQEGGFAAETRTISARAALQAARTAVVTAETEIGRLEIRAPFGGTIEDDAAELGTLLQPGALCATIHQLDPMLLVGFAAEADIDRILPGALAGGRLASGREVMGEVTFISRSADPMTRTFRIEITVPNTDLSIRDGLTVEMLIQTTGVEAHLLPGSAMTLDDRGRLGVRIVDDEGRAAFAPVRVLRDTIEGIWVTGLPETVTLITVGQEFVTEGTPVEVTLREIGG